MSRAAVLPLLLLAACGPRPDSRPAVEVTTRSGIVLVLAHAELNYQRICHVGSYDREGSPAPAGLLYYDSGDPNPKTVAWSAVDTVTFADATGNAGEFCQDLPDAIEATVLFKDGHKERHALQDTTDRGLEGVTEHGKVVVPLRNVASLKPVTPGIWPWVETYDPPTQKRADFEKYLGRITLRVTKTDQTVETLAAPDAHIALFRTGGGRNLDDIDLHADGLPVFRDGVRYDVPWIDLAHVTMSTEYPPYTATMIFNDRHQESGKMPRDGGLTNALGAPGHAIEFDDIRAIDVTVSPGQ